MRFALAALCALLLALPARAEDDPAADARRLGYAFDYPRVLAQQRIFGLAHGVALLAAACHHRAEFRAATDPAHAAWLAREQAAIDTATQELLLYYQAERAPVAAHQWLVRVMGLTNALDFPPDSEALKAACATLPQALAQPRYRLAERFRLEAFMAQLVAAQQIEAHEHACQPQLPEAAQAIHAARYALWRELNAATAQQAQQALARDWPADAPAASFADWQAELQRNTKASSDRNDCLEFSAALKRPETALRNAFTLPPTLPAPSTK